MWEYVCIECGRATPSYEKCRWCGEPVPDRRCCNTCYYGSALSGEILCGGELHELGDLCKKYVSVYQKKQIKKEGL